MKIILDAMGGDNAPEAAVLGALDAHREFDAEITLVGRGEEILNVMRKHNIQDLPKGLEIANADDVVDMHDDPTSVIHKRKNSSMVVGLKMLADGQADAFVSAGNTGALLTGATLLVKRVKGIRRAAFCPEIPTDRKTLLIDCGANAECTPEFLVQFAFLGAAYAKKVQGKENPKVGLLNIGTEDTKGTELQKQVYGLLQKAKERGLLNFVGNVEAREVMFDAVDVVVTDGFSGNVLLKSIEGTAGYLSKAMKSMFTKNLWTKLAALLCKDGIASFKKRMDYREVGGTMLLGITKPVVKAHGSSDARAIRSAVRQAMEAVQGDVTAELQNGMQQMALLMKEE